MLEEDSVAWDYSQHSAETRAEIWRSYCGEEVDIRRWVCAV
jgi:hypothetical protein